MTEESGMDGAFGLQPNWLQADILINTDSEEEGGDLWAAPGIDFITTLPLSREAVPAGFETLKLTLKGLKAATPARTFILVSATPTSCWRASCRARAELDIRLIEFTGGTLRNAIPREAFATLASTAISGCAEVCCRPFPGHAAK